MEQAAQVHGVLFKIANGQKLQLVVVVVAVLFAITLHLPLLLLRPLITWEFPSLGRFNNVRPFVSHKFAQQFTQYITVVHQVEPQPRIDPQLHMLVGEKRGGARLSPAKRFISLLNCEMSQHFRLFGKCKCQRLCLRLPSPLPSLLLLLPLHPLRRASLRLLLDLICHRDLPVVFMHVIYCPHSHKDVFIMRFSTLFLLPLPPPWRFSSQANRYQQFGIVWKLICK